MKASKKIVFFVPSFSSIEATAPLGILAISTPLLNAGYEVKIIASTITPNYKKRILEEVERATGHGGIGAVLRREGIYSSTL